MRFSLVAVAALATSVSANLVSRQDGLPACAATCIATANFGSCSPTDDTCLCNDNDFVQSSTACITNACQGADLQAALSAAQQLCLQAGVTLTSTPATGTAAAPGSTGSASPSDTGATPSTTSNAASINGASMVAGMTALGLAVLVL